MKNFAMKLVWFTTLFVFVFAGLNQTNTPIQILMILFLAGSFLIPFMVYTILTDKYTTTKTFKDWYEDHPIVTLEKEES